jgi:hypothetical protein
MEKGGWRTFGENVNARKFHNMTKELIIKASLYNMFYRYDDVDG